MPSIGPGSGRPTAENSNPATAARMKGCRNTRRRMVRPIVVPLVRAVPPSAIISGTMVNSMAWSNAKISDVAAPAGGPKAATVSAGAM